MNQETRLSAGAGETRSSKPVRSTASTKRSYKEMEDDDDESDYIDEGVSSTTNNKSKKKQRGSSSTTAAAPATKVADTHYKVDDESLDGSSPTHFASSMKHIIRPEVLSTFIIALFDMMNSPKWKDSITWSKEGEAIVVKDQPSFVNKVLRHYFKHSNMSSFVRQLNMYGFHKVGEPHEIIFKHPSFIRGHPELLKNIHRRAPRDNRAKYQTSTVSVVDEVNAAVAAEGMWKESDAVSAPATSIETSMDVVHSEASIVLSEIKKLKKSQEEHAARLTELQARNSHLETENNFLWMSFEEAKKRQEDMENTIRRVVFILRDRYGADPSFLSSLEIAANDYDKPLYIADSSINMVESPEPLPPTIADSIPITVIDKEFNSPTSPDLPNDLLRLQSVNPPVTKSPITTEPLMDDSKLANDTMLLQQKPILLSPKWKIESDIVSSPIRLDSLANSIIDPSTRSEYYAFANSLLGHNDQQGDMLSKIHSLSGMVESYQQ